jgi:CSLREA domain-containing protein
VGKTAFRLVGLIAVVACAALLGPAAAQAYVINVTTTADEFGSGAGCSLREAVQVANDASATDPLSFGGCTSSNDPLFPLDEIRLPASNYVLTLDGVDDTNAAGDLDVLNEGLSILGQATTGPVTIDGGTSDGDAVDDRVIDFHPSAADGATQDLGLTGLVITGGTTAGAGGGIRINGPPNTGETITADFGLLTVTGNTATGVGVGGGIENQSGEDLDISESTISGNAAIGTGAGVDTSTVSAEPADTQFENVTVSNNIADSDANDTGSGGGVAVRLAGATGTAYNTIIGGNADLSPTGVVAPDCNGTVTSGGYDLIGSTANCAWTAGAGDLLNIGPGLAPLALIPGAGLSTVLAHDLLPGSPAREAGNPAPVGGPVGTCGFLAQNFGPRPQGPRCDIGSVEADYIPPPAPGGAAAPLTAATGLRAAALKKCKKKKSAAARRKCKRRAKLLPV